MGVSDTGTGLRYPETSIRTSGVSMMRDANQKLRPSFGALAGGGFVKSKWYSYLPVKISPVATNHARRHVRLLMLWGRSGQDFHGQSTGNKKC